MYQDVNLYLGGEWHPASAGGTRAILNPATEEQIGTIADATEDESLAEAGVDRCAGVAATLGSDADNLYVVISARLLNPDVQIVARAHDDRSAKKLTRGGANRVVSPYGSGAAKMGQLLTNPRLNEFVEIISDRNVAFDIVGLPVTKDSPITKNLLPPKKTISSFDIGVPSLSPKGFKF